MTHVRNMESLSKVVDYCTGFGGKYDPRYSNLQIEALTGKLEETREALTQVIKAKTLYDDRLNERKQAFDQLPHLASSVIRSLEAAGVQPEKLDDVRRYFWQLTGRSPRNREPIPSDEALAQGAVRRSVGQASYVHKADAFARLVEAVSTEPQYDPSDQAHTLEALKAKARELDQLNDRVSKARVEWGNSLVKRDRVMYSGPDSAAATVSKVKKHIRASFGLASPEYTQVKGIVLAKPK